MIDVDTLVVIYRFLLSPKFLKWCQEFYICVDIYNILVMYLMCISFYLIHGNSLTAIQWSSESTFAWYLILLFYSLQGKEQPGSND